MASSTTSSMLDQQRRINMLLQKQAHELDITDITCMLNSVEDFPSPMELRPATATRHI